MQYRENTDCIVCVYDDVWGIYSGEYISQLYVRGRPHVHLIYHPVDALNGPNELGGVPLGGRGRYSLKHFGFVSQPRMFKGSV